MIPSVTTYATREQMASTCHAVWRMLGLYYLSRGPRHAAVHNQPGTPAHIATNGSNSKSYQQSRSKTDRDPEITLSISEVQPSELQSSWLFSSIDANASVENAQARTLRGKT